MIWSWRWVLAVFGVQALRTARSPTPRRQARVLTQQVGLSLDLTKAARSKPNRVPRANEPVGGILSCERDVVHASPEAQIAVIRRPLGEVLRSALSAPWRLFL